MRIGIDIDETIVNTHHIAVEYTKKNGSELMISSYEDLYSPEGLKFLEKHLSEIQRGVEVFPDVLESLKILKENNFELIFITARGSNYEYNFNYDYKGITEETFNKYNIPYDKIIYKCFPKGETAHLEKIDYFIDDKEENLDDVSKFGIKCIKKVSDINESSKYIKFDNWKDILNYLLEEVEKNE